MYSSKYKWEVIACWWTAVNSLSELYSFYTSKRVIGEQGQCLIIVNMLNYCNGLSTVQPDWNHVDLIPQSRFEISVESTIHSIRLCLQRDTCSHDKTHPLSKTNSNGRVGLAVVLVVLAWAGNCMNYLVREWLLTSMFGEQLWKATNYFLVHHLISYDPV